MSEMVERVAIDVRAKLDAMAFHDRTVPAIVRLVIEAMQEPTEGMLKIGDTADNGDDHNLGRWAATELWKSWIDEALK